MKNASAVNGCAHAVVAGLTTLAINAHAALPAGTDTAFDTIEADLTTLAGYAATVVMVGIGFNIALKLTKRYANKV